MSAKLTKKQKKAVAFRDRKRKGETDNLDVPLLDDPGIDDGFGFSEETLTIKEPFMNEQSTKENHKKRKREEEPNLNGDEPPKKAKKLENGERQPSAVTGPLTKKKDLAKKYILFIGMSNSDLIM
jgi:nucleolar protein 6